MKRKDEHTRGSELDVCNIDIGNQMDILIRLTSQSSGILYVS